MTRRRRPEKPLVKQAAEFVIFHLADKSAFHPFTGTDYDAWQAYVPLIRLWGRTRSASVVEALRAVVSCAQHQNVDVMAVFKKAIPCVLDWSDESKLWAQIWIGGPADSLWPCPDGARICKHERNKPYTAATPEPGYTLDQECKDCGAVWRQKHTASPTT